MEKKLVLIDGHAILHRAYHAFPATLTTRKGELVNAVYGFTRMLLEIVSSLNPEYLAVSFDVPGPNFRHGLYLGYHSKRPKMDEDLSGQIKRVIQVVESLNIPIFMVEGFEADDVIGTLSRQANEKGIRVTIITGDKDIFQVVNDKTEVYMPAKGFADPFFVDRNRVFEILGVHPDQVVDYKSLVGDASDNYPGVPGIGPKTAARLLEQYQTLEGVYSHLNEIEEKTAAKLKNGAELAKMSQKLATISVNVPIKLDLRACLVHDYDQKKAQIIFDELEFKSLANKLPGVKKEKEADDRSQLKLI